MQLILHPLREAPHFAFLVNESTKNIGAQRLHSIMERVPFPNPPSPTYI